MHTDAYTHKLNAWSLWTAQVDNKYGQTKSVSQIYWSVLKICNLRARYQLPKELNVRLHFENEKKENRKKNINRNGELNVNRLEREVKWESERGYHRKQKRSFNILSLNRLIPIIEYWSSICVSFVNLFRLHCFHILITFFSPFVLSLSHVCTLYSHAKNEKNNNQTFIFWCERAWIDSNAI